MKKLLLTLFCLFAMFTVKAQCDYTLEMNDSWGDGWNEYTTPGASNVDVWVGGVEVLSNQEHTSGSQTLVTFTVNTGDDIYTVWQGGGTGWGGYEEEISYRILDSQGNEVANVNPIADAEGSIPTGTLTGTCPSCGSALATMSAITTTGATATWAAALGAASYDWEVVPTGNAQGTGVVASGTATTFSGNVASITGLTANTGYDFLISSDCTDDYASAVSFNTSCTPVTTAFDEDFGAAGATFADLSCWEVVNGGDSNPWVLLGQASNADSNATGNYWNLSYNSVAHDDYLYSRPFTVTVGVTDTFSFKAWNLSQSWPEVIDVIVVDSNNTLIATLESDLLLPTPPSTFEYDLTAYAGTDIRIGFYSSTTDQNVARIDDFSLYAAPTCANPINIAASNIDSTGATATWDAANGATSYDWEVVPTGNAQGIGVVASGSGETGLTATITGLTSNTEYDFLISSDCTSEYASAVSFLTASICSDTLDQFCYENGSNKIAFAEAPTGDYITVTIDGEIEDCCDILAVYDSLDDSGNVLYATYGFPSGLQVESTTGFISVWVVADGSYSCSDGQGGPYTPIDISYSCFTPCNWTGTTSSDWADVSNWSTGAVPTSSDNVFIDGTFTNEPSISGTDAVAKTVIVTTGNTLTIDETSSLTISGDFTNTGTVTLNSTADDYSSLIVTGTASGDIVYNRYVNVYDDSLGGGWDLVCSPVGMSIADFITANGSNIQVLDDDYAFSQFNNATGQWERYATASQTGSFEAGKGYSMATTGGSTVAFTGAMQTADQSINIINNNGLNGVGRRWNLVSNPFPSYILGNTAAGTNNFMDANSAVIDSEFLAVYGWNGSSYTIYNQLSGAFSMAPGQGFWVAALNTTDTALNFTAAMRTTTGTGDFVSSPQLLTYNVAVKLYNGEIEKATTDFYFRDGLSLDLDPGYDAAAFNQSMALSTRLPQGSQETAFGINAMGMDAMQNTRVPLEIRQNAGQAFRVSIADMELPEDIYVYLEDTLNGTLTSLKDGDFELVAQSNLSGSDRFFIVFKSNSVLSNGDTLGINALNVYKANTDSFVTIAGISPELGKLNVSLYNILGQTVREKALSSATATQRVSTDGLASGLYIVQIRSGNQTTVKKIIVK